MLQLVTLPALAQGLTVSSTVRETDGSAPPGVTVQIQGIARGTQTAVDGGD